MASPSSREETCLPSKKRTFTMLENNPKVLTDLAHALGLTPHLAFHDVYSLTDPALLAMVPRACHALLVTIPMTPAWRAEREREDAEMEMRGGGGDGDEVVWFKQTINHACGMLALVHCLINSGLSDSDGGGSEENTIVPGSLMDDIRLRTRGVGVEQRCKVLKESEELMVLNERFAIRGDTLAVDREQANDTGNHFVAFVSVDSQLWELEGSRAGAILRGRLAEGEDVLSSKAVEMGLGRYVKLAEGSGAALRFSCTALAARGLE